MRRRHPNLGGLVLLVVMVFGIGVATVPGILDDRAAPAEVRGLVVAPDETPRGEPLGPVVHADHDPPSWLLPSLAALLVFFGVTGIAASRERNPPARFR